MRLIAIEGRILPPSVREAWASAPPPCDPVTAIADGGETGERLADLGEGRLALIDEQGVDVQVLSLTTPRLRNLEPSPAVEGPTASMDDATRRGMACANWERLTGPASD